MNNFTFYSPTKVIFGKASEAETASEIKAFGGTRVMVVYGGGSAVKSGLLDRICRLLDDAQLPHILLGGVQPNPRLSLAKEGIRQALEFGADFILAIGGGSVIDTAKGIAIGTANPEMDIWQFWTKDAIPQKSLPIGAILTIPAAGSETSESAVLTNDETMSKRGLGTELNRPKFAVMNPELAMTLPKYQIICGIVDIMMHTLDRYFTKVENNEFTDEIAEALLRTVMRNGRAIMDDPLDYQAMSELMWCGSISHNGITGLGRAVDFAPHQLGHELSAKFDVAHGASLSAVWGSWALYCFREKPERFVRYAEKIWGINTGDPEKTALSAIDETVGFFASIGAPTCLSELGAGIQDEETLRELADRCVYYGSRKVGQFRVLESEDIYEIYKLANR